MKRVSYSQSTWTSLVISSPVLSPRYFSNSLEMIVVNLEIFSRFSHLLVFCHQTPDVVPFLYLPPEGAEPGAGAVPGVEEEVLGLGHGVDRHGLPGQVLAPFHVATGREQA